MVFENQMRWYKADLHIHSVLSPCGGLEMSPIAMMKRCNELGIDWIAITDHNSMANCPAYEKIAQDNGIAFTWGVEIQSAEEIHVLAYFDNSTRAREFDKLLYNSLLPVLNDPDYFGDQVIIDENENIINVVDKALINSSIWGIDELCEVVKSHTGYCFPAHIDAQANSIISQLGFIPLPDQFSGFGITAKLDAEVFLASLPTLHKNTLIRSSDAHYLCDLGSGSTKLYVQSPCVEEIILAIKGEDGRKIEI